MSGLDWLIAGTVLLSVILAISQGFIFEIFSLAGVAAGYLLAAWEYPRVASWYAPYVKASWIANGAAFVTIFFAVVLLAGMVGRIVRWGVTAAGLRVIDRVLGGAFGLVRGALVVVVVLLALTSWAPDSQWLARSQLAPYLLVMARGVVWLAPAEVRAQFRSGMNQVRQLQATPEQSKSPGK
jgi:membrane protein required for colicin V production